MLETTQSESHSIAASYFLDLAEVLERVPTVAVARAIDLLLHARATGRRVYVIGNGGSAATASHFVCDLTKTARLGGMAPLRAFALADNGALVTAWANDTSYENVFAEQLAGVLEAGDVVIAISASGNSPNIVAALKAASEYGAHTIALVGFDGGVAGRVADVPIHIHSSDYGLVEDTHSAIGHALAHAVRHAQMLARA
jgi:D-sedoheptulose 7-phosphate isomerase